MEAETVNKISIAEYISISQEQNQKYEYHDGNIFATADETINHSAISTNILGALVVTLLSSNSRCLPFNSDVRLHIEAGNKIVYPDAMVVCNEVERSEAEKESITNPTVIIEVLSENTESYDRGDKFYFYHQIPSLKEYILVSQDKKQIEVIKFKRNDEVVFSFERYGAQEKFLKIESIEVEIPFDAIYRNVEFEA